jgi:hypothetical protein
MRIVNQIYETFFHFVGYFHKLFRRANGNFAKKHNGGRRRPKTRAQKMRLVSAFHASKIYVLLPSYFI